jgi:hypothetical protein
MARWLEELSTWQVLLLVACVLVGGSLVAALLGAVFVRLGMRRPWVVRRASRVTYGLLDLVKRPLTIVVLDEVAAVIQTGHYTKNISDALRENHDELKLLVAEMVRQDPNARLVSRLPGYETIVSEVTETVMRVLIQMLSDPRMDELVSDLLRNNLEQIKRAVRERQHEGAGPLAPPDPVPPTAPSPSMPPTVAG